MHLYNAWLPPPVAAETWREAASFAAVVRSIKSSWCPQDPDSAYSTIEWISTLEIFLRAKSEISLEDVDAVVVVGLEVFQASQDKLYVQVRWGIILSRLLRKFGKKLSIKVHWRPFYDCLINTHFKRNIGPEGWKLKRQHFETLSSLMQSCRKYFPSGSACEIWDEFRFLLENPWRNSTFEGCGFLNLFLPMNIENEEFFTIDWIKQCIDLWDSVPNCEFWDVQWAMVIARCIKNYKSLDWECLIPSLFTKFLNIFEVPIASGSASYPFTLEVQRNIRFLFSSKKSILVKAISKSIVHLLKPGSSAQVHFEKFADLLEQFYHPSNGGEWTPSLEHFLRHLVIAFEKRLKQERPNANCSKQVKLHLGKSERASFVKTVLKLIERGQYSKNESLARVVAGAMPVLSYIEPSVMLPFITSRFHLALETDTATHQLKTAIRSVAYAARPFFFALVSRSSDDNIYPEAYVDILAVSLSNSLLGVDANDPPKTLATMQLIVSIFSNLPILSDDSLPAFLQINFSEWLDELFSRLFSLLLHLEPNSVLVEGSQASTSSRTFLIEENPYYFTLLEILLGKLSKPLYMQVLKKISKFVNTNILTGATSEVGLLCCACINANPEEASHHLLEPILLSTISSLKEAPISGYGGKGLSDSSFLTKATVSPALETVIEYHLKVLSVAISHGGPSLLCHRNELKEAIAYAFEAPSWKVNIAGNHLLRSLFGSLVLYYPIDQYKSYKDTAVDVIEEWMKSKFNEDENIQFHPIWHIPSQDELLFANELMDLHFCSALDDLLRICQTKLHSEAGNEKNHLKVTMLRILSSLQGVLSCLPDLCPSFSEGKTDDDYFFIAGATGVSVGSRELREKAVQDIHVVCKYLLDKRSDDSILFLLVIQIMEALGNVGSLESEQLSSHMHSCNIESAATVESSCNFFVSTSSKGQKRPRWFLIEKVYMHNTWRLSQSLYHKYRTDNNLSAPDLLILLMDDLLKLSLHRYDAVRTVASISLLGILKRWPSLITKCIHILVDNLCEPSSPEHVVVGSCAILASQTVLRHLTKDAKAFSSFTFALLASSHHESLKAQRSITELFIKYNISFSGMPRSYFRSANSCPDGLTVTDLISQISSITFDSNGLHWRYDLMANRLLLLLTLASKNNSCLPLQVLVKTTGHFLQNLRSELPLSRMLSVSALNMLLSGSNHKYKGQEQEVCSELSKYQTDYAVSGSLKKIFQEEDFFNKTMNCLSHVHIINDNEDTSVRGNQEPLQSMADRSMTFFYFDFSATWPRTPGWLTLLRGESFYPNYARLFKRLVQECGPTVILALQRTLEEFSNANERSKQCVAAEMLAGILHSDVNEILEAWESWIANLLQKIITSSSTETLPEWTACIRYALTGKGKYGLRIPLLRDKILDFLLSPLPKTMGTQIIVKRYYFILAALIEISPTRMNTKEVQFHNKIMEELLDNMSHSSAQVREVIGASLCVLCSNLRHLSLFGNTNVKESSSMIHSAAGETWARCLTNRASEIAINIQNSNLFARLHISSDLKNGNSFSDELLEDAKRMETMLYFVVSSLRSGRFLPLSDIIIGLLYPIFSLQETSHKDLSILSKACFELLKFRILPRAHLEKCITLLSSFVRDSNWRTRFSSLSYLRAFMYRHTFILTNSEKTQIWTSIEDLLVDNQVEVREHAAGILASLMMGGDENIASSFRVRAYAEAVSLHKKRMQRNGRSGQSVACIHGTVLALSASVLSVPYDMPSWLPDHVTLLARFISEPSPVKSTVTKSVAEFRRTHADTWTIQKDMFTEDQLEVLADTSSSTSYFA